MSDEQEKDQMGKKAAGANPFPAGARLANVHAFGVNGPIRSNCEFTSENMLVHPVGQHVALYNIEDREMHFLQKSRTMREITAISVAPKRNVIAVCEAPSSNDGSAQVSVFHVQTRNRMRTMSNSNCNGNFNVDCRTPPLRPR